MGKVVYSTVTVNDAGLEDIIRLINRDQDKIIAVTESGGYFTIFYEQNGNEKGGGTDG